MKYELNSNSNDNTLFVTAQCNNRCLMCCQPPIDKDDIDFWYNKNLALLKTSPDNLTNIGISGGEPTLLGDKLISLIHAIRTKYKDAHIHILSNGRAFTDFAYATKINEAAGGNLTVGVPLHSDYERDHNLIAGADGAYEETMYGLYNLTSCNVNIELRIVINQLNYKRLPHISQFIYKNLPFVSWIAFMGMEDIGYTIKNRNQIWVEPNDYKQELEQAVLILNSWGLEVSIYNIPLCLLTQPSQQFAQKSISDWKIRFKDLCDECKLKEQCGGLFNTSRSLYSSLTPFK